MHEPQELEEPIRIGVSACLLGEKVRYDGGHKHDRYLNPHPKELALRNRV